MIFNIYCSVLLHHIKNYRFLDQVIILNWIMIPSFRLLLGRILERVIDSLMDVGDSSNAHGVCHEDIQIVMITLFIKVSVYSINLLYYSLYVFAKQNIY